jgi:hypothetical protein
MMPSDWRGLLQFVMKPAGSGGVGRRPATGRFLAFMRHGPLISPGSGHCSREEGLMRRFYLLLTISLFSFPASAQIQIGPGGIHIGPDADRYYAHHHHCRELRDACMHKEEYGEQGQGNCERYHHYCD